GAWWRFELSTTHLNSYSPLRVYEQERRQVRGQYFRARVGLKRSSLRLIPKPVTDAGLHTPCPTATLIGGGTRYPYGFQPRDPDVGLVTRYPRQPAVDHDPDSLDSERRFGDRGCQHHFAPSFGRR